MFDHYPRIELPIPIDVFHRLPRNAAYKFEYFGGRAVLTVLTPRPKTFSCVRDLSPVTVPEPVQAESLPTAEILDLTQLFHGSNRRTQPWESLDDEMARAASVDCLTRVVEGKDGPVVVDACVRAVGDRDDRIVGAALVTLVHPDVLTEPFGGDWPKAGPPADAVALRLGVPHLTWVFVHPWMARKGIGTALLAAVVDRLRAMGFGELASTFALDNGPSALWHWRNGFRLLPQMSAMREQIRKEKKA